MNDPGSIENVISFATPNDPHMLSTFSPPPALLG